MKIKCDFITNSSSTSFIVYVPKTFSVDFDSEKVKKMIDKQLTMDGNDETIKMEDLIQNLQTMIESLKIGCFIEEMSFVDEYADEEDLLSSVSYKILINILSLYKLILTEVNSMNEDGCCVGVSEEKFLKIYTNHHNFNNLKDVEL